MSEPDIEKALERTFFFRNAFLRGCERVITSLPRSTWLLIGIVALAFLIRAILIPYGLPLLLYEDEPIYYGHALNFGLGHWALDYFKKPSFFLYLYGGFYYLAYLYSPYMYWKDYVDAFWQNPTYVATVGRLVSTGFAAGSVWMLGKIGRKAFSLWVGMAAAFLLAFDTTHLRTSPIVISDIPSLFFILCSAWFALWISESGRWRDYIACALCIALAMSFKYNVFSIFFLISAHMMRYNERRGETGAFWRTALADKRLWCSLALVPVAFLLLNVNILFNVQAFWQDINLEKRHMLLRSAVSNKPFHFMGAFPNIFFRILPKSMGWPLYVSSLLGYAWLFIRYRRRAMVLLSFPTVFLLVVLQFALINAKYLLPLFPFFYLGTAVLLQDLVLGLQRWIPEKKRAVVYTVLVVLMAFPILEDSARYVSTYVRRDTRDLANDYVRVLAVPKDRFLLEPDTITLNNRARSSVLVIADFMLPDFAIRFINAQYNGQIILGDWQPRYILINFGQIDKQTDAHGRTFYRMSYAPKYYAYLEKNYQLREVFTPFPISINKASMRIYYNREGLGGLYAHIQDSKGERKRPGPLMLLLEQKPLP